MEYSVAVTPDVRSVVIVTGASRGIGAGLVAAYRQRGWAVVANARAVEPSRDADTLTVAGDVTEPATCDRIVAGALERFGRVDTLVNNAGMFLSKPFTDYTEQDYTRAVALNLTAFFHLTQRVVACMLPRRTGHIVTITTTLADRADSRVPAALTTLTKGGLVAATRSLAIEYARHGIRVNAVSPGVIRTATDDPAAYDDLAQLHPLGRVGRISDVVDGVLFLETAPFITGEVLHIDGGQIAGS
jgi:NAD(P)-dependent dehydrogenase (short-subunit alcohol dehydrogenase family)